MVRLLNEDSVPAAGHSPADTEVPAGPLSRCAVVGPKATCRAGAVPGHPACALSW